jgi:hypothetical protein
MGAQLAERWYMRRLGRYDAWKRQVQRQLRQPFPCRATQEPLQLGSTTATARRTPRTAARCQPKINKNLRSDQLGSGAVVP